MPYTVQIRLEGDDLALRMSEMREWLDSRSYELDVFTYRMDAKGVLFRLDFKYVNHAEAFAEAFAEDGAIVR